MPFCTSCGIRFKGRGVYCALHDPNSNSYADSQVQYSSNSTAVTTYETEERPKKTKSRTKRHGGDDHRVRVYQNHDAVGFPSTSTRANVLPSIDSATLHHLHTLAASPLISNITLTVSPSTGSQTPSTYKVSVTPNQDREQCHTCKEWFPDRGKLDVHAWDYPSGCEVHEICFTEEEEYYHGMQWRHERCFVSGCKSVYRREGGWKKGVVREHVAEWHCA